jgi:hypothetical protein
MAEDASLGKIRKQLWIGEGKISERKKNQARGLSFLLAKLEVYSHFARCYSHL